MGTVGVQHASVCHAGCQCLLNDMVKNLLENIAAIEAADAVLAESGRIRYFFGQAHAQEPAVSDINLDFFHQTAFRRDPEQVSE